MTNGGVIRKGKTPARLSQQIHDVQLAPVGPSVKDLRSTGYGQYPFEAHSSDRPPWPASTSVAALLFPPGPPCVILGRARAYPGYAWVYSGTSVYM